MNVFKPKNLKREKYYFQPNKKYYFVILGLLIVFFAVFAFIFSGYINPGAYEEPEDYTIIRSSEKTASHKLYYGEGSLRTATVNGTVYYMFNTIENNVLSDAFLVPENDAKVIISDNDHVDVFTEEVEIHYYKKYFRRYEVSEEQKYYYEIYITPQKIENVGNIEKEKPVAPVIIPYFWSFVY